MVKVLVDSDVRSRLDAAGAVQAMRRALVDAYRACCPPRLGFRPTSESAGSCSRPGATAGGPVGFRVYGLWPGDSDQAVLVWDGDGRLIGCVVGREIGARRTGALGGAAVDALAREDAATIGIVGSGVQAWTQLWAIAAVRKPARVRVYSPTPEHRAAFARRAEAELGLIATACDTAEEAVTDADLVVLATRSELPVVEAAWIRRGTHVNTVGPKLASAHETPAELAEGAAVVVTRLTGTGCWI